MVTSAASLRAKVQAHWRSLDALTDAQSGGNEAILRALDIFEGASSAFKAVIETQDRRGEGSMGAASTSPEEDQSIDSLPKGGANVGVDNGRRSYFRAEEGLSLAQQQLERNAKTLSAMAAEVEGAKRCIGELVGLRNFGVVRGL